MRKNEPNRRDIIWNLLIGKPIEVVEIRQKSSEKTRFEDEIGRRKRKEENELFAKKME